MEEILYYGEDGSNYQIDCWLPLLGRPMLIFNLK